MKIYRVGGSVRDELLGLPVQDRDHVVVGATPEEMERLGYKPVGRDFPVFLHPETHEEYALARTERKTARGYKGFQVYTTPDVTLEDDLLRRDLTINAIAKDEASGAIIDPHGGVEDLKKGILRHVSPAFMEDPVRVLRVARFAARFGFTVARETLELMREMARNGEIDHLVPERTWQELANGLMEKTPSRMFQVLRAAQALAKILPEVDRLFGVPQDLKTRPEGDTGAHTMRVVDFAASRNYSLAIRFAALTHDLGKGVLPALPHRHEERSRELVSAVCERLKVPSDCRELALLSAQLHENIDHALDLKPEALVDLLLSADAFRRPERFADLLLACACDFHVRPGYEDRPYPQAERLRLALRAASGVDAGKIAEAANPQEIAVMIRAARVNAVAAALKPRR